MSFVVRDGRIKMDIPTFHDQVLPYYPNYRTDQPSPLAVEDYRRLDNCVGHTQRAYLCYWALRAFDEQRVIGLDVGSAGVVTPMCLSLDIFGNGQVPVYGGIMSGVQIMADAEHLDIFQDDSFSCVLNSHLVEHLHCEKLLGTETVAEKIKLHCPGIEILPVLKEWIRVLRSGGYLVMILPDNEPALAVGSNVFFHDVSHQHSWTANEFYEILIVPLVDAGLVKVVEHNMWNNFFSFATTLRKQ